MAIPIAYHPIYVHPVPDNHKFPMEKYELLYRQLLYEGLTEEHAVISPNKIDKNVVLAVHDEQYFNALTGLQLSSREQRVSGFVHNQALIDRELIIMEGTRLCAERALVEGVAANIAGGTHHAYSSRGEGFCLLNDQVIAAQWLLDTKKVNKIVVVDLDVHQGNGTAEMAQNNDAIYTFSMHGASNYPLKKEISDWDIALKDGTGDDEYLEQLKRALQVIEEKQRPDFVFYQCGVDVLETDTLGKLALSLSGCKDRDELVVEWAYKMGVPLVLSMGGGYSKEIKRIVEAHTNTFRVVSRYY